MAQLLEFSAIESAKLTIPHIPSPNPCDEFHIFMQDFIFQPKTTLQTPLPSIFSLIGDQSNNTKVDVLTAPYPSRSYSSLPSHSSIDCLSPSTVLPNSSFPPSSSQQLLLSWNNKDQPFPSTQYNKNTSFLQDDGLLKLKTFVSSSESLHAQKENECQQENNDGPQNGSDLVQEQDGFNSSQEICGKRKRWDDEDMSKAMELVREKKMSARAAAIQCNVPRSTLWDRLAGRVTHGIDRRRKKHKRM
jgi:hypothetical protein